ncbi:conserved protein of unknown function [Legionella micdadei]|uniref:Uncharacterized protein n=1 Tax=Legionella micdadei TaxID=451 RepID=A0A098GHB5_LEGMI|nr:conserved protein of unknown function [Legionella micdadei]
MRKWTQEERLIQSQLTKKQKPWKYSTGPKTSEGKERVSRNAYKHGGRCADVRKLSQKITEFKKQLTQLVCFIRK